MTEPNPFQPTLNISSDFSIGAKCGDKVTIGPFKGRVSQHGLCVDKYSTTYTYVIIEEPYPGYYPDKQDIDF